MRKICWLFVLVPALSGCLVHFEHSGMKNCPIHGIGLEKTTVRSSFGLGAYSYGEGVDPFAKGHFSMGCYKPVWPLKRWARIDYCTVCSAEEKLVFTTDSFSSAHEILVRKKKISFEVKEKCTGEIPRECSSRLVFSGKTYPELTVQGSAERFAAADLNGDGTEELLVLAHENGNWHEVYAFAVSRDKKGVQWHQCLEPFLWYPGFEGEEGCSAKIYHTPKENYFRILTTNAALEDFPCTSEIKTSWKEH